MAYVGVVREEDKWRRGCMTPSAVGDNQWPVANLCMFCFCPPLLKHRLVDLSKDVLDWDIYPPTLVAQHEGGGVCL